MALFLINNNPILCFLIYQYQYFLNDIIILQTCTEIGNNIGMKSGCGMAFGTT